MIPWLEGNVTFPDVRHALKDKEGAPGLLAAGGDLTPERLLAAYRQGIFPWYSEGQPILWWSPDPRMVLFTERFKISKSLQKTLRKIEKSRLGDRVFEVKFDSAFRSVMLECAAPRRNGNGTWISGDIVDAYTSLHAMGHAHSAELWFNGELVGGAYGVAIGRMFYGESMFARIPDASKIALAHLVHFLKRNGVQMIDCQQETSHLASLGATPIPREEFIKKIRAFSSEPEIADWKPLQLSDWCGSGKTAGSIHSRQDGS